MLRYAAALKAITTRLAFEHHGWARVVVAPGEERVFAEQLAGLTPGRPVIELDPAPGQTTWDVIDGAMTWQPAATNGGFLILPGRLDDAALRPILNDLNARRDWLSDRGVWVLVVSRWQMGSLQYHAGDIASVFRFTKVVPFEPRPISSEEATTARAALARYYHDTFSRLDLRGFARTESEDSSFPVEAIYQPIEARMLADEPPPTPSAATSDATVRAMEALNTEIAARDRRHRLTSGPDRAEPRLIDLLGSATARLSLILGGPGAGKSFFLRWCALHAAREPSFMGLDQPLPVFLTLATQAWTPSMPPLHECAVEELLRHGLVAGHLFEEAAQAGRLLLLLDGLDETPRPGHAVDLVQELAERYPKARILVTSRPTGLDGIAFHTETFLISPLSDDAIRTLLTAWCELYEHQRVGTTAAALAGRRDGERLAQEVLSSRPLRDLATSPLLATIIGVVHRAGVRLPDHRVELYDHVVRILVERWNLVRSRNPDQERTPIRVPDAIRLLGPVAVHLVESTYEAAFTRNHLRDHLKKSLAGGAVRGITEPDEAIDIFRNSLGLLVERAPGVFGFLHKTIAEYLAAHEVTRTGRIQELVTSAVTLLDPRWRETLLLSIGIYGVLRADDAKVSELIEAIIRTSAPVESEAAAMVAAVLADDPGLSTDLAIRLADVIAFLPPHRYWSIQSDLHRILGGRWRRVLVEHVQAHYAGGLGPLSASDHVVQWYELARRRRTFAYLEAVGMATSLLVCECFVAAVAADVEQEPAMRKMAGHAVWSSDVTWTDGPVGTKTASFIVPAAVRNIVRAVESPGVLVVRLIGEESPTQHRRLDLRKLGYTITEDSLVVPLGRARSRHVVLTVEVPHAAALVRTAAAQIVSLWQRLKEAGEPGPPAPTSVEDAMARYRQVSPATPSAQRVLDQEPARDREPSAD